MNLEIRPARRDDVDAIERLAAMHALREKTPEQATREGFLVSNFTASQYEFWLPELTVAEAAGDLVAFALVFAKEAITGHVEDSEHVFAVAAGEDLRLIKQVAVAQKAQRMHVGKTLYSALLSDVDVPVFAPILLRNSTSIAFHQSLQFFCVSRFTGIDGSQRGLWRWMPPYFGRQKVDVIVPNSLPK